MVRSELLGCLMLVLGVGLFHAQEISAQDIARLQSGVVKITAKPPQGTAERRHWVHCSSGQGMRPTSSPRPMLSRAIAHPKVEFFTKRNMPVTAEVLGLEGDDEVRGLALMVVRGQENLPKGLTTLVACGSCASDGR